MKPLLDDIDLLVTDFDGVLTDDRVLVSDDEHFGGSRADWQRWTPAEWERAWAHYERMKPISSRTKMDGRCMSQHGQTDAGKRHRTSRLSK